MCGRFTLAAAASDLQASFPGLQIAEPLQPRYNIAPSQPVAVIANNGQFALDYYLWGLVPAWAKDPQIGSRSINARAETLAEKPTFRSAFRYRRCLVLADGFYEWKPEAGRKAKTPYYIRLKSGGPFAFAGLWERWSPPDGSEVLSCAIVTTQPNPLMAAIHPRMPVILPAAAYDLWLSPGQVEASRLQALLQPYPAEAMDAYPVSMLVNSPANDVRECLLPA